ncbi:MAG TPA: hypothetical protein DIW52_17065, partial [Pseudomonas sp.]|nr:hypothetical protein [Pseudomonas sp.]
FGVIMLALVPDSHTTQLVPKIMPLKEVLQHYIEHRHQVVVRRTQFELDKALEREHILEGLKIAVDNIDAVIKLIRAAEDTPTASAQLQKRFKLSERQAEAILNMRLAKLTGLEIEKLEAELKEVLAFIKEMKDILASKPRRLKIIRDELQQVAARYGDERRSEITSDEGEFTIEDLIAEEDMVIAITRSGYIKRLPVTAYREQRRGGIGVMGMDLKDEDYIEHLFVASTHAYIMIFTDRGRAYWLKVHEIPDVGPDGRGKAIANLEVESLRHLKPTFHGDTIYAETKVLEKRESQSKPDRGIVTVETDMTDIGTGSYTIIGQTAAEMMGVSLDKVVVRLGDSSFPVSAGSGGQFGANCSTAGVYAACVKLREAVAHRLGVSAKDAVFADGEVRSAGKSIPLRNAAHAGEIVAEDSIEFAKLSKQFQQSTFGAHFVEVAVDSATGETRVRRMLAVCAAGRILNPTSARSQVIGAMTMGVGAALMEELAVDKRRGFFVNHDLAGYEVPVHADIPHQEVIFLDETDAVSSPMKAKGVGELGLCGVSAAIANAVYNATGIRVREYPITLDKMLDKLPPMI